jgi:hypothetical protein
VVVTLCQFAVAGFLGAFVAYARLTRNIVDAPWQAIRTVPGAVYLGVNAVLSLVAFGVLVAFDLTFGVDGDPIRQSVTQTLAAGLGAPLLSQLLSVKVGTLHLDLANDVNTFLRQIRRAVAQRHAADRLSRNHLARLDFAEDCVPLIELVNGAFQPLDEEGAGPRESGAYLRRLLEELRVRSDLPDCAKLKLLELELVDWVGWPAVRGAARMLERMREDGGQGPPGNGGSPSVDLRGGVPGLSPGGVHPAGPGPLP